MRKLAIGTMLVGALGMPARAEETTGPNRAVVYAGAGIITPGTISFEPDLSASTSIGPYVNVGADLLLGRHVSIGVYIVYSDLDEVILFSAAASLKARFALTRNVEMRIGIGSAFQKSQLYINNVDKVPINGWGLSPIVELGFAPRSKLGLALQVSAVSQIVGDLDAVWSPIPTVALLGEMRL